MTEIPNDELHSHIKRLPEEADYTASDGLTWNDEKISDFIPIILYKIILLTNVGYEDWFLLGIIHDGILVALLPVKTANVEKMIWFDISPYCIISPDFPKAEKYLAHIIRYMLNNENLKTVQYQQIDTVGWHKIKIFDRDNIYGCYDGEQLILPQAIEEDMRERIRPKESDWVLKSDKERYTEQESVAGVIKVLSLNRSAGLPIFAFILAALLKSIFRECGIILKFVLYVCGLKDRLKTAYTSVLYPITRRIDGKSKPLIQFNSSTYSIDNLLNDYPDFPIILDNVYMSEDNDINRRIKKTFEEAAQSMGDDAGKSKAGKEYNPSASIIAIGENDGLGNPSTIARYFTIPFGDDLRNPDKQAILHKYQNDPLIISTFYSYFLQWVTNNIDDIKAGITSLLTDFREISNSVNISPKLRERYFILLTSYMLFLKYCKSKDFFTNVEIKQLKKSFSDLLIRLCNRHNETIIEKEASEKNNEDYGDFLRLIKYWYRNDEFDVADSEDDKDLKNKEALIYDGCLCLRTKPLMEKINKSFPKAKLNHVIALLVTKKVLKSDSDRNTAKIKGIRFLKIPLDKL